MSSDKKLQPFKVYARQRPLNKTEIAQKCASVVHNLSPRELVVKTGFSEKRFVFDGVFGEDSSQVDVYNTVIAPLIGNIIAGYSCTVFAYGQTGTGKTHTIYGETKEGGEINLSEEPALGFVPRVAHQLFSDLSKLSERTEYTVSVSFIEIYNEEVRDLLNDSVNLRVYDDPLNKGSVCIKDLSKMTVVNKSNVYQFLSSGLGQRQHGATSANIQSSRSHTLFTFAVDVRESTSTGEEIIRSGKLQLIDLAGSENTGRSGTVDVRARESGTINRSLITLTKVIKALAQKMQHVPFRDSKLTRILQDSLGSKAKTTMVVTFSPNSHVSSETLTALELAIVAKSIQSIPQVTINKKHANLMKELQDEISKLKDELCAARTEEGLFVSHESYQKMTEEMEINKEKIAALVAKIKALQEHHKSLELEYVRINMAFKENKVYLEGVKTRLEETQKEQNQERTRLETAAKEHQGMFDKAKVLLEVCDNSTKRKDIYYKKYEERGASTSSNAQQAQEMLSSAKTCFRNIGNVLTESTTYAAGQNLQKSVQNMHQGAASELNQLKVVLDDIQKRYEVYRNTTYEVLKKNDVCLRNAHKIVCSKLEEQKKSSCERQEAMVFALEDFKSKIEARLAEFGKLSDSFEHLRNTITEKQEILKKTFSPFSSVRAELCKKEQELLKEIEELEAKRDIEKDAIAEAAQNEARVEEEIAALDATIEKLKQAKDFKDNEEATKKVQDLMKDYVDNVRTTVETQKSVIGDVIQDVGRNKDAVCNETASSKQAVQEQVDEISLLTEQTLRRRNEELLSALGTVEASLRAFRKAAANRLREDMAVSNESLESVAECQERQYNFVKNYIENTLASLKELKVRVNSVGHVGNTPSKVIYSYPRVSNGKVDTKAPERNEASENDSNKENQGF